MASKRKVLCIDEKVCLIRAIEKGEKQSDVGRRFELSHSTVATIWKNRDIILKAAKEGKSRKRIRKPKFDVIDQAVLSWLKNQRHNNVPISGTIVKAKAKKFAEKLGMTDFRASEGWLGKFKHRHKITYGKINREARDVDMNVTNDTPDNASVQQKRELRPEPEGPEAKKIKSECAIDNLSYDIEDSENPVEDPLSEPEVYTSDKIEFEDIGHSDTSSQLSAQSERCKRKRVDYVRREAILRIKHLEAKKTLDIQILKAKAERYRERRRLATPSPTPSPPRRQPAPTPPAGNWFKSLDRLTRKKGKNGKVEKESIITTEDESTRKSYPKSTKPLNSPAKNLRFFGDTDPDSDSNVKTVAKPKIHKNHGTLRKTISSSSTGLDEVDHSELSSKSYSLSNLHRVEKSESPHTKQYKRNLQNISEIQSNSETESQFDRKVNSKPPISPYERSRSHSSSKTLKGSKADLRRRNEERGSSSELRGSKQELSRDTMKLRRRTPLTNSGESSTEGDSSHQSQRSVVYLHATTVGDIPDPGRITRNRSRDDVSSVNSSNLQVRSTTKSFSIFAPWTPKHYNEQHDVHYAQRPRKPKPKETVKKAASTKTLVDDRHPTLQKNKSYSQTTLTRRPQNNRLTSSSTTLYKKPEKRIKESTNSTLRKSVVRDGKKSQSSEVINRDSDRERVSRSISMPKDNNKKAGWLKFSSKSKKPEINTRVR